MTDVKKGQEVRIFDVNSRHRGDRGDGWPGKVEKVGSKLAHINYHGRTETFRLDNQRRNDPYGYQWFRTLGQIEEDNRRRAALDILRSHHVELGLQCTLSLEQIEAIAAVLSDSEHEEERDG
jgi:hypothetical protein